MPTPKQIYIEDDGSKVAIKEYIDMRFDAVNKGIDLSERNMQTRLEGLNEWRQQSLDQTRTYITRKELEALLSGRRDMIALAVAVVSLVVAVVGMIWGGP